MTGPGDGRAARRCTRRVAVPRVRGPGRPAPGAHRRRRPCRLPPDGRARGLDRGPECTTWSSIPTTAHEPADRLLRTLDAQRRDGGRSACRRSRASTSASRRCSTSRRGAGSRGRSTPASRPLLRALPDGGGATHRGLGRRATSVPRDVSVTLRPGTARRRGARWRGLRRRAGLDDVAVAAADERGRVSAFSTGPATTIGAARLDELLDTHAARRGRAARAATRAGLRSRSCWLHAGPDELLLVAHLPPTPPEQGFGRAPVAVLPPSCLRPRRRAGGRPGADRDATERPLGVHPSPGAGVGDRHRCPPCSIISPFRFPTWSAVSPFATTSGPGAARLEELRRALERRARPDGSRVAERRRRHLASRPAAARHGQGDAGRVSSRACASARLSVMWWPTMVLLVAALEPGAKGSETAFIATTGSALGALTDWLLRWPRGPVAAGLRSGSPPTPSTWQREAVC